MMTKKRERESEWKNTSSIPFQMHGMIRERNSWAKEKEKTHTHNIIIINLLFATEIMKKQVCV
jgi:hypothetical protein